MWGRRSVETPQRQALPVDDQPSETGFRVSMRCAWHTGPSGRLEMTWHEELVLHPVLPRR